MTHIEVYPNEDALAQASAEAFVKAAKEAIRERGRFFIALAGGSTPEQAYRTLASDAYASRVNWDRVYVFWSDERTVPPDHQDSNYGMAHETLLKHVPLPADNIHRLRGEIDPTESAAAYEAAVRETLPESDLPVFDLIHLGMGDDGHTASLFPGTAALNATKKLVVANYVDKLGTWRLTFTPTLMNAARQVIFLVSGEQKAAGLFHVLEGPLQPAQFPSQAIRPENGTLTWMVDAAAAARLHR